MTYDEFKQVWQRALRESGLPVMGVHDVGETLDLRSMDRVCESYVEPLGGSDAGPFHVGAKLSFRWSAVHAARTATTEDDLLRELLGRDDVRRVKTKRPWLRVDVSLRASLPYDKPMPMPSKAVWAKWAREAIERLEKIEPVVPEEVVREGRGGRLEFLAWQGEPVAEVCCRAGGDLWLQSVELSSWQAIEVPRRWSDPDHRSDPHPIKQLATMFARLKAALHAWMECLDNLRLERGR